MSPAANIAEIEIPSKAEFDADIRPAIKPVVMRGLVKDWPAVFDNGQPQNTLIGAPEVQGRFTYSDDLRSQNYATQPQSLTQAFQDLLTKSGDGKARFIQSA